MTTVETPTTSHNTRLWLRTLHGETVRADQVTKIRAYRIDIDLVRRTRGRGWGCGGRRLAETWLVQVIGPDLDTTVATGTTEQWAQRTEKSLLAMLANTDKGVLTYSGETGTFVVEP